MGKYAKAFWKSQERKYERGKRGGKGYARRVESEKARQKLELTGGVKSSINLVTRLSFWKNPYGRSLFRTSTVLDIKKDSY